MVHHTSFLWDYSNENMSLLKNPKKQPKYRNKREHNEFLSKLSDFIPSINDFHNEVINECKNRFDVEYIDESELIKNIDFSIPLRTKYIHL